MRIGQLAEQAEVSRDTLRFYERSGLIASHRHANGYRDFPDETLSLVRMIRLAQRLGFSLGEIGGLLDAVGDVALSQDAVAELLTGKIAEVDARIADLTNLKGLLQARLDAVCPLGLARPALPRARRRA